MMHEKLMKKLEKKGKKLSPLEQKAKMDVVKELQSQAGDMMGEKLKGLKKVTVASDSEEGLKAGLEKAEEVIEQKQESEQEDESEEMSAESDESEEELSPEEIDAKIQELMALKKKKEQQA